MNIKTKIEKRVRTKTNSELVEAIILLKKTNLLVAKKLAGPVKKLARVNLTRINEVEGDVLIVGKVLASGDLTKKAKVVGWSASEKAIEKIKESGGSFVSITEELKKNPKLENLEVIV